MNLKVCIECGDLTESTRCANCQGDRDKRIGSQRGGANARGYGRSWQNQAAIVKREQPFCAVCGSTTDLTVDHIIAKRLGGTDDRDNLTTLCRTHNSAKGGRA